MGGVESRGVLRKISDMLEVILKRMDSLSKLDNTSTTDASRRLDELSSAISRYASSTRLLHHVTMRRPSSENVGMLPMLMCENINI